MIDFTGQVAIVTGAGRGLGRLYAVDLARRGASVVVNDLGGSMAGDGSDRSVADQVVEEIETAGGVAVVSYDSVATPEGGEAIVRTALDNFGRLDALVSNAGIFGTAPFDELTVDQWRRMREVHLDGSFFVGQPAFRAMKAQGYGRMVFIASSAGMFGQPLAAHYSAAKAGIIGLMNVVAVEGAPHGITANCVLPFGVSRMVAETVGIDIEDLDDPFFDTIAPELVVPITVFLASRACNQTHQSFSALGGRFARAFAGLGPGWCAAPDSHPTADDIAAHLDEVVATEPFSVPGSIVDEIVEASTRVGFASPA